MLREEASSERLSTWLVESAFVLPFAATPALALAALVAVRHGRAGRHACAAGTLLALRRPLVYDAVRLAVLSSPSYGVAKFSELPELLVASGLLAVVLSWRRLAAGRPI